MAAYGFLEIKTNDGSQTLLSSFQVNSFTPIISVTSTGVTQGSFVYTYSGDKEFLGVATSPNATEATYVVGGEYTLSIPTFEDTVILYIVEGEAKTPTITDLKNTTWNIAAVWECVAEYGQFDIQGEICVPNHLGDVYFPFEDFNIGYTGTNAVNNVINVYLNDPSDNFTGLYGLFPSHGEFSVTITGGADATNPKLIAWLSEYGELQTPSKSITFDISTLGLSAGEHNITVVAQANGYEDSAPSNAVSYTVYPMLEAPTISIRDDTLTITDTSGVATAYSIYANGVEVIGTTTLTNDLTKLELAEGTHTITVVAHASGYRDSSPSNAVDYTVESEQTIAFTIDGAAYQAEPGMTWAQWVNSDYNTNGTFYHTGTDDIRPQNGGCVQTSEGVTVCGSDVIKNKEAYRLAGT